ncbi:hypothetical protein Tco_1302989, partial [Tanacetum coccineum]
SWSIPSEDPYEEAARQLLEQAPRSPEYVPDPMELEDWPLLASQISAIHFPNHWINNNSPWIKRCTHELLSCHSFDVTACASYVSDNRVKPIFFCAFSISTWPSSLSEPIRALDLT